MVKITYSMTMYVVNVSEGTLDNIRQSLSTWAEGNGSVCTSPEAVTEWLKDNPRDALDERGLRMFDLLKKVQDEFVEKQKTAEVGIDIIFSR